MSTVVILNTVLVTFVLVGILSLLSWGIVSDRLYPVGLPGGSRLPAPGGSRLPAHNPAAALAR